MNNLPANDPIRIREVWDDNLEDEFALIRDIVDDYPYIGMDTEFPGVVLHPECMNHFDKIFQTLRLNVDHLKLIQLGLTFSDKNGTLPTCGTGEYCIWQFNFKEFNPNVDDHNPDSIALLRRSGIDLERNHEKGVDATRFAELLMSSGVVMNNSVYWVTFHGGYDFGYLLKLLTCKSIPDDLKDFMDMIKIYFPIIYDIKHLMKFVNLGGGLSAVAQRLNVERVGIRHQAGSDSLLTCCTFMKLKRDYSNFSFEKYAGVLYDLELVKD